MWNGGVPDLWDGDPFEGVHKEHAGYEVPCPRRQVAGQVVDPPLDLLEQVGDVFIIKGQTPTQQGVQDYATAPDVDLWTSIQLA